jgi:hypothetical protein
VPTPTVKGATEAFAAKHFGARVCGVADKELVEKLMHPVFSDKTCIPMKSKTQLPNGDPVSLSTVEPVPSYKTIDLIHEEGRIAYEVKAAKLDKDGKYWPRGATPTSALLNYALKLAGWSYRYVTVGYRIVDGEVTDLCIVKDVPADEHLAGPFRTQWQVGRNADSDDDGD